jgi:hypothetical protein
MSCGEQKLAVHEDNTNNPPIKMMSLCVLDNGFKRASSLGIKVDLQDAFDFPRMFFLNTESVQSRCSRSVL